MSAAKPIETVAAAPLVDETFAEVRYGETDQMGYAHHATAVLWFELGRVHWLRKFGLSYGQLEASGLRLPVVALNLRYHAPARFEDQVVIETRLAGLGHSRVTFENRVLRLERTLGERTLLVSGTVELACLDRDGRIQRVPAALRDIRDKAHGGAASTSGAGQGGGR